MENNLFLGKYGRLRRSFLEKTMDKEMYKTMSQSNDLDIHLQDIENEAKELEKQMIEQMLKSDSAPDKATDQMGWVQHMNMLRHTAEEIILNNLIYQ